MSKGSGVVHEEVLADSGRKDDTVIARLDRATHVSQRRQMGARSYYVYILASRIGGTLYTAVTNDLVRRVTA